ncbi:GNAT family N-acetyltransferase [Bacillus sp. SCS-151]|uniref:GNAT family N-acetyltransferase n=1 Tax=Nanhaiella sioensis TaxID=3115293 RepID=UPI0039787B03
MIRKLKSNDHKQVFSFLEEEASFNLFLIGDIEAFGYEQDFQDIWGEFDENNQLIAVLLRYYQYYIPYAKHGFDVEGFVQIIKKHDNVQSLSGKSEIACQFENIEGLKLGKKQNMFFCECVTDDQLGELHFQSEISLATIEDVDGIIALRSDIEEFVTPSNAKEMFIKTMKSGTGRTYVMKKNGQIIASASTTAENSISAMIVGVCTHQDYRNRGYATEVMKMLCKDLLKEGKTLCLFYDNPGAGRIYKKLGFVDIGKWVMYR